MSRYYIYDSYTDRLAEFAKRKGQGKLPANYRPPEVNAAPASAPTIAQNRMVSSQSRSKPAAKLPENYRPAQVNTAPPTNMAQNRLVSEQYRAKPNSVIPKIGNPSQKTLRQKLIGTSVAGRGLRAAGVLGAGAALVGGGMALKRRADRKAQERSSIKGRVKRLLGR